MKSNKAQIGTAPTTFSPPETTSQPHNRHSSPSAATKMIIPRKRPHAFAVLSPLLDPTPSPPPAPLLKQVTPSPSQSDGHPIQPVQPSSISKVGLVRSHNSAPIVALRTPSRKRPRKYEEIVLETADRMLPRTHNHTRGASNLDVKTAVTQGKRQHRQGDVENDSFPAARPGEGPRKLRRLKKLFRNKERKEKADVALRRKSDWCRDRKSRRGSENSGDTLGSNKGMAVDLTRLFSPSISLCDDIEGPAKLQLSFRPPLLSLTKSDHKALASTLTCSNVGDSVGCVMTICIPHGGWVTHHNVAKFISIEHVAGRITRALAKQRDGVHKLAQAVHDLMCKTEDDLNVILDVVSLFRNVSGNLSESGDSTNAPTEPCVMQQLSVASPMVGRSDLEWWADSPGQIGGGRKIDCRRHLAFFRRLLLPLCARIVTRHRGDVCTVSETEGSCSSRDSCPETESSGGDESEGSIVCDAVEFDDQQLLEDELNAHSGASSEKVSLNFGNATSARSGADDKTGETREVLTGEGPAKVHILDFSLVDVLLLVEKIQPAMLEALLCRLLHLERASRSKECTKPEGPFRDDGDDGDVRLLDDMNTNTKAVLDGDNGAEESFSNCTSSAAPYRRLQNLILLALEKVAGNHMILSQNGFVTSVRRMLSLCPEFWGLRNILLKRLPHVIRPQDVTDDAVAEVRADTKQWIEENSGWQLLDLGDPTCPKSLAGKAVWRAFNNHISFEKEGALAVKCMEAKSCPPGQRALKLAIRRERVALLRNCAIAKKKDEQVMAGQYLRRSARKLMPHGRSYDGSLLVTSNEMSISDFLARAEFMEKVNATFPRTSIPGVSRPRLQQLDLSQSTVSQLKALFFDEDGSLSNDVRHEINNSMRNDPRYIEFRNRRCPIERKDKRWQVPLRKHGAGYQCAAREKVESLFIAEGVITPFCEELDEIGLLFGGTEDQSLHHDAARQMTGWLHEKPATDHSIQSLNPVSGWEIDRLEYNQAMSSAYAPSSILVGLGDTDHVLLGVQKDQIERIGNGRCKIIGGRDESFRIVRENDHLVVVQIEVGAMFTGDFPHAGVRNFPQGTLEDKLMTDLNEKIAKLINDYPHERSLRVKAMIEMMCNFPGLDKLCRLHISTEMLEGHVCIPPNTIGFSKCWPNSPDPRCYDEDTIPDEQKTACDDVDEKNVKPSRAGDSHTAAKGGATDGLADCKGNDDDDEEMVGLTIGPELRRKSPYYHVPLDANKGDRHGGKMCTGVEAVRKEQGSEHDLFEVPERPEYSSSDTYERDEHEICYHPEDE